MKARVHQVLAVQSYPHSHLHDDRVQCLGDTLFDRATGVNPNRALGPATELLQHFRLPSHFFQGDFRLPGIHEIGEVVQEPQIRPTQAGWLPSMRIHHGSIAGLFPLPGHQDAP